MDELLNIIRESLFAIRHPRFYETERGFQGALLAQLVSRIPSTKCLEPIIVEQEYQKRMSDHGMRIRPDLIIHVPFAAGQQSSRREGNFVAFELKLKAGVNEALADYANLSSMCEVLNYPLCVFINIGASSAHLNEYYGPHKEKLHAFSVRLYRGQVEVREEYAIQ